MSLRLYTICAVSITASAVAGLLVGGFIASEERDSQSRSVSQVSKTAPVESTMVFVQP